jgi:FAD/FMN-containing dehydrogenase
VNDHRGRHHPADLPAIQRLVRAARAAGRGLRVVGAQHSAPAAIFGDEHLAGRPGGEVVLCLDQLRAVELLPNGRVRVGAGVRFGHDPRDPKAGDPDLTGLCPWLHARGRALPTLGGIAHQTVVGFLQTGSAGASLTHALHDAVERIELVDGTGAVRDLGPEDGDLFLAAGCGAGLCGIVTAMTLRTVPAYDVIGVERVQGERGPDLDLFDDGPTGPAAFFAAHDDARLLWWPQTGVQRVVAWATDRVPHDPTAAEVPYRPMPVIAGSTVPVQAAAGAALWGLTHLPVPGPIARLAYRAFVGEPATPTFRGPWWRVLPMDQEMKHALMPVAFTELWIPLHRAAEALRRLRALFDARPETAGAFAIELYPGRRSPFLLSPGFGGDCLRINPFLLTHLPADPRDGQLGALWEALADLQPLPHLGKLLPAEPATATGHHPGLSRFRAARDQLDPAGIFLTSYWRSALDLPGAPARPVAPTHEARPMPPLRARWPLPFVLEPCDLSLLDHPDHLFDLRARIDLPPERAPTSLFDGTIRPPLLTDVVWYTPPGRLDHGLLDEHFAFFALRLRTEVHDEGRRVVAVAERTSMPVATRIIEVIEATPAGAGSDVRWRIAMTFDPRTRGLAPAALPLFGWLFRETLARGARQYPLPERV